MEIIPILKQFGLNDKEIKVYIALLENGPTSVRNLASHSGINRGTVYDILKSLKALGLASYYHKETKQFFVAEDPEKLTGALEEKEQSLLYVKKNLQEIIPKLKSLYNQSGKKPVVKYYENNQGIKTILKDVLEVVGKSSVKNYYVFSSSTIRPYIHKAWPSFTADRIKQKIKVSVIAMGHAGTPALLSERKSLTIKEGSPTYTLLYGDKVAMISVNENKKLIGLIVEDRAIFQTQLQLFTFIWKVL